MKLNKLIWVILAVAALLNLVLVVADCVEETPAKTYTIDHSTRMRGSIANVYQYTIDEGTTEIFYSVVRVKELVFGELGEPTPANLDIRKGEVIKLELESENDCTFEIPKYGIKANLYEDEETELVFNADRDGLFEFHCSRYKVYNTGVMKVK